MKKTRERILAEMPATLASGAGLEKGLEAYKTGDYATAEVEFRSLAHEGNAVAMNNLGVVNAAAMNNLGVVYEKNRDVEQSALEAARCYLLAAEVGLREAQNNLGRTHCNGMNATQDDQLAYMGFNLAAAQGLEEAKQNRKNLTKYMTKEDIIEAQKMSRMCLKQGYKQGYAIIYP